MRPLTMLRLLRANPAALTGRALRSAAEAGEGMVRDHRVIGSPGYPLDEVWLRRIGELMYVLASGDRRPALITLRISALVLHGQADPLIRPETGHATAAAEPDARLVLFPAWATTYQKDYGPAS